MRVGVLRRAEPAAARGSAAMVNSSQPLAVEPQIELALPPEAQDLIESAASAASTEISYSPSTGKRWLTEVPPREPSGMSSLMRST